MHAWFSLGWACSSANFLLITAFPCSNIIVYVKSRREEYVRIAYRHEIYFFAITLSSTKLWRTLSNGCPKLCELWDYLCNRDILL